MTQWVKLDDVRKMMRDWVTIGGALDKLRGQLLHRLDALPTLTAPEGLAVALEIIESESPDAVDRAAAFLRQMEGE